MNPLDRRQLHLYHRRLLLDVRPEGSGLGPPRRFLVHLVPVRRLQLEHGDDFCCK